MMRQREYSNLSRSKVTPYDAFSYRHMTHFFGPQGQAVVFSAGGLELQSYAAGEFSETQAVKVTPFARRP
jgi:hypothetical protein